MDYQDFKHLSETCAPNVAVETMAAIVEQESGFNPYAIGVNGEYRLEKQPQSKDEALKTVYWLRRKNKTNLDIGLSQINTKNIEKYNLTIEETFDPCINIKTGAKILTDNYQRAINYGMEGQEALLAAISEYNTGDWEKGFENGYVQRVINKVEPDLIDVPALKKNPKLNQEVSKGNEIKPEITKKERPIKESVQSSQENLQKEQVYQSGQENQGLFVYKASRGKKK